MSAEDRTALSDRLNDPYPTRPLGFVLVGVGIPDEHDGDCDEDADDHEAADVTGGDRGRECQDQVPGRGQQREEGGEGAAQSEPVREV